MSTGAAGSLSAVLDGASRDVRRILTGILDGSELSLDDGITLTQAASRDLHAVTLVADEMRRRQVGDVVTYVVNRNINFTNVCSKHCGFCAFSRDHREEEGYLLPVEEVVRRAHEAWELGATEVCIQAGLPAKLEGRYYIDLTRAIKGALPVIHVPGASAGEVLYGSVGSGRSIKESLAELQAAGLGRRPGERPDLARPDHRGSVGRCHYLRACARHPFDLDDHVRPRRDAGALDPPHGAAALDPKGHRRVHRVRPPLADPLGGADVRQAPGGRCAARRHRRRGRE